MTPFANRISRGMHGRAIKANYHTHCTWCDGRNTPEEMVLSAIGKGFDEVGFSSHAMLPGTFLGWGLSEANIRAYAAEIRALAARYEGRIKVLCGVEADYAPPVATPERSVFGAIEPDYIIGSVHYVAAPDGAFVCADESPESLEEGIRSHFGGSVQAYVRAYFAQERRMIAECDFDIIGHIDLVRKFNKKFPCFSEDAAWYREELELTALVAARSGKAVEINTGAISRGWMDDAYPSKEFREILAKAGARFLLGSDAHCADALDCAFDRFGGFNRHYTATNRNDKNNIAS